MQIKNGSGIYLTSLSNRTEMCKFQVTAIPDKIDVLPADPS